MKYKVIIFDFFGVISSEVAPFWFEKHFTNSLSLQLKEKYVHPADKGEISESKLFDTLAELISASPTTIRQEWFDLVQINSELITI